MADRYADIVLPLARPAYTFAVPDRMDLAEGQAVVVQFGARRYYTGIVWRIHDRRPDVGHVKPILRISSDVPLLTAPQRRLWEWIAAYYLCTPGEVMRFALPQLVKPTGLSLEELIAGTFRPRTEPYVSLDPGIVDEEAFDRTMAGLIRRAPRQHAALLEIAAAGGERLSDEAVPRRCLEADAPTLAALRKKGLIRIAEHERSTERRADNRFRLPELTPAQQRTLQRIVGDFDTHPTVLLQGVTGSGKTEIYIHLIARTLADGGDALMLVPEIALTSQLIARLERIFGSRVTAYHSKLPIRRRTESFLRLARSEGGELVIGARSAIFLPLKRLRLVIVDEEHEPGYKQSDSQPRYQARDAAVMMAALTGGHTLLGSATPSLESYANACSGKYGYARLDERYADARLPRILVSDTLRAVKRGERQTHFNRDLTERMAAALRRGEQILLFQNRRGFAPYVECPACGWSARCPHCNVTLTYHKREGRLQCHYCGHTAPLPEYCPDCGGADLRPAGFGTEKVEEELAKLFPEARIDRLDRDTATSESAYNAIIARFESGRTDILVGTQMIAKGFDFERVSLVGILNADNLLLNPDFRAAERAFQLMTQVAGRAGRRDAAGEVVIQTSEPDHPLLRQVIDYDYDAMARTQLAERAAFGYPPYARLTETTLRGRDRQMLYEAAAALAAELRERFGRRIMGPVAPPVDRIRETYIVRLLLKVEPGASAARARAILCDVVRRHLADPRFKSITASYNVDPQ